MQNIRIYEIFDCNAVASGVGMFGDGILEKFDEWFSSLPRGIYPKDFLYWDDTDSEKQGYRWIYLYEDGMNVPEYLSILPFKGGLYAVTTDIDMQTDMDAMNKEIDAFLSQNGFERDTSRPVMGNVITSPRAKKTLGYDQMNYWTPVKEK